MFTSKQKERSKQNEQVSLKRWSKGRIHLRGKKNLKVSCLFKRQDFPHADNRLAISLCQPLESWDYNGYVPPYLALEDSSAESPD